jgi:hypothetical protein
LGFGGDYIVDFFCKELMPAIEIDGAAHNYTGEEAQRRQANLEKLGIKFLSFTDGDVKENVGNSSAPPPPNPLQPMEGEYLSADLTSSLPLERGG